MADYPKAEARLPDVPSTTSHGFHPAAYLLTSPGISENLPLCLRGSTCYVVVNGRVKTGTDARLSVASL